MTSRPLVSVIIPAFNREQWLPVSVGSVLAQTFQDWELILVDDHSTDRTAVVAQEYATRDSRIRYAVNERSKGPAGARNHGFELARGEFIAFLDSDDEWEPCHLQDAVSYLTTFPTQIDLFTAGAVRKNRATGEEYSRTSIDVSQFRGERLKDAFVFDPQSFFDVTFKKSLIITQTMVMKRAVLEEVPFDEDLPPGPEDRFFHLEVAYRQMKVAYLPRVHVTYWAHGDNLTCCGNVRSPAESVALFLAFEKVEQKCLEKFDLDRQRRDRVRRSLARTYFWKIGYNSYLANGEYQLARRYFRKGIRMDPYRFSYWKTYVASYARQLLSRANGKSVGSTSNRSEVSV